MITICIDCGASFIKAARFEDGRLTDNRKISAPGVQKQGLIFFPEKIRQMAGIVKENILVMAKGKEIHLCISNEMHGFVLTDPCGEPYTDYISWQMELGNIRIHENTSKELLCKEEIKEDIRRSGMPVRAGLPSTNLFYLIRSGKLSGKELHFYTLGDYIIRFLSGIEPLCHPTNAGATGLFDLGTMEWNDTLIAYIGAENVQFPKIGIEKTEFELEGIRIHCCPAIGDQQAALLGAGFMREGILSFNLGTGAQVSMLARKPEWEVNWQCRPYFNGYYLRTIPHIPSGRALNVYFRFVKSILREYEMKISDEDIWDGIYRAALKGETSCLEFDLGFFENAVNQSMKGKIEGITEENLVMEQFFYALLKKLAKNCIYMADKMTEDTCGIQGIVFSGGIARRFEIVREWISAHFPGAEVLLAENDTFYGLYQYSLMHKEEI